MDEAGRLSFLLPSPICKSVMSRSISGDAGSSSDVAAAPLLVEAVLATLPAALLPWLLGLTAVVGAAGMSSPYLQTSI